MSEAPVSPRETRTRLRGARKLVPQAPEVAAGEVALPPPAPEGLNRLFSGANYGKQLVRVSPEPAL